MKIKPKFTISTKKINGWITFIILLIAAVISVFPFFWMVVGSTNTSADVTMGTMSFGSALKVNWNNLVEKASLLRIFWNTAKTTLIYTFLSVLICSMAGYGFEKYRSKSRNLLYNVFLISMMIPFASQMIPLFKMMNKLKLMDTHTAIILPTLAMPFLIFFFRQSFISFPTEIIEASRIDGANELRIFFSLVLPPMRATFAAGFIYSFMKQWNNYLWPLIVLQSNEQKTFTLLLSSLSSAYFVDYGQLMLAIVLATLPILIVFLTMQKHFVTGIVGSSK
ncbi:MAG: carbohydrate ABC transporter permease [Anaerolineaceae bacterium]|nr:MAG: carbohydrate ABC transporter permease [Anaerolineaceae bacterium]